MIDPPRTRYLMQDRNKIVKDVHSKLSYTMASERFQFTILYIFTHIKQSHTTPLKNKEGRSQQASKLWPEALPVL